jgi:cytochrome c2
MPQFSWANDPAAIEEVMTLILGLTGEYIPGKYLPKYGPEKAALAQGEKLLERFNCRGCHVFQMPRYTISAGADLNKVFKSPEPDDPKAFETNVSLSYQKRAGDYAEFFPGQTFNPEGAPTLASEFAGPVTIEGMPIGEESEEDDQGKPINRRIYVQLWRQATIRGHTFNPGDTVILDPALVSVADAEGGDFAWLFAAAKSSSPGEYASAWNRLPPPLLREGLKVQTPWLTSFLQNPAMIRPAAGLRMPRFHWGYAAGTMASALPDTALSGAHSGGLEPEARDLANYFAARDGAEFPYQVIPQRDASYLSERESKHPDYLSAGWSIMTKGLCVQCHAIGSYKPTGGEQVVNGPDLRDVANRFRPGYLYEWLGQPQRLVPFTAMPQNIPPRPPPGQATPGVPPSLVDQPLEQVRAMRDTLLNYSVAVERQLATSAPPGTPAAGPDGSKPAPAGGGEVTPGAGGGR